MKIRRYLGVLGLLALLSACTSAPDEKKDAPPVPEKETAQESPLPLCPQTAIVRQAEEIKDYGRETPAPNQLVAAAHMTGLAGTCEYTDFGVAVAFELGLSAQRGPRLGGSQADFPFFVAVINPAGDVTKRDLLTARFSLSHDHKVTAQTEKLHIFIPLAKSDRAEGASYRVLVGFLNNP